MAAEKRPFAGRLSRRFLTSYLHPFHSASYFQVGGRGFESGLPLAQLNASRQRVADVPSVKPSERPSPGHSTAVRGCTGLGGHCANSKWRGRDGNDPSVDIAKDADQRF